MNENKLLLLLCISICCSFLGLYVFIEVEQWAQYEEYKSPFGTLPHKPSNPNDLNIPFYYASIVASALTSITSSPVVTYHEYLSRVQNDTELYEQLDFQIFYKAYLNGGIISSHNKFHNDSENIPFSVYIVSLTGVKFWVEGLNSKTTVQELKERIQETQENAFIISQRLVFDGQRLINTAELGTYNIGQDDVIYLDIRSREGLFYSTKFLSPDFEQNYQSLRENHHKHGRKQCGWKRIPLTTKESNKFWPLSYHGTSTRHAKTIADDGFDHSKGHKFNFDHGIYTTPDVELASLYAKSFYYEGSKYLVLLENRVNPKTLVKLPFRKGNKYWVSPSVEDVKPYGLLVKKIGYCK